MSMIHFKTIILHIVCAGSVKNETDACKLFNPSRKRVQNETDPLKNINLSQKEGNYGIVH
ncbi:hypothetical protein GCM10007275_02380 [Jeotgalicoccus coquinae]|nr:hypothetical protein GCM10007275_02380 [Jeotgalicoccus coquinae]